jgi:hypothetical protein
MDQLLKVSLKQQEELEAMSTTIQMYEVSFSALLVTYYPFVNQHFCRMR